MPCRLLPSAHSSALRRGAARRAGELLRLSIGPAGEQGMTPLPSLPITRADSFVLGNTVKCSKIRNATIEVVHNYLCYPGSCKKWQKKKKDAGREAKTYRYHTGG